MITPSGCGGMARVRSRASRRWWSRSVLTTSSSTSRWLRLSRRISVPTSGSMTRWQRLAREISWTHPVGGGDRHSARRRQTDPLADLCRRFAAPPGRVRETSTLGYTVTGDGLPASLQGETEYPVKVTAPDRDPRRLETDAAINVWLPAEAAAPGTVSFHVEVSPAAEMLPECTGCFPNGNKAELTGMQFQQGGGVSLLPVDIQILHDLKLHRPSAAGPAPLARWRRFCRSGTRGSASCRRKAR